jgi:adenosylcobinamide kinase/adenosylcobinamide-phosphate guanylyltransferase
VNSRVIFITGGARSGKSSLALKPASMCAGKKAYIATAEPLDSEMLKRIKRHKAQRGDGWDVIEEPLKITDVIEKIMNKYTLIVLDCLTLWVSNLMTGEHDDANIEEEYKSFIKVLNLFKRTDGLQLIVVSNEIGMGIVPDNPLARRFRDQAGKLNQIVAETADEVYLVVSGIPVRIKG